MTKVFHSLLTAIDVGTTKISVLIAQKVENDGLKILGIGRCPSKGLNRGVVVDINQAVASIQQAIKEAELMAGCTITAAYVGISGAHIQSFNSPGAVPIKKNCVTQSDIEAVLAVAQAVPIEEGQKVLHALPQFFIVDGKEKVSNPLGLHGIRLEAMVHVITGAVASIQNLIKCCELAGVSVQDIVLEQLASAYGVLSADERDLGVGMLDIGGGTSDFAIYQQGTIRYTKVFPIAGNLFTKDLAVGLRATIHDAERLKKEYGTVLVRPDMKDMVYQVESVQGGQMVNVSQYLSAVILQARAAELLKMVDADIRQQHIASMMVAGLVITGGGSLLSGIDLLAQKIMRIPVRLGAPRVDCAFSQALSSPIFATGYGLLRYAIIHKNQGLDSVQGPIMQKVLSRMKSWVENFF